MYVLYTHKHFSFNFHLQTAYRIHLAFPTFCRLVQFENTFYTFMNSIFHSLLGGWGGLEESTQKPQSSVTFWFLYFPKLTKYTLHTSLKLFFFTNAKAVPVLQYWMRWSRNQCTGGVQKRQPTDGVTYFAKASIFVTGTCLTPAFWLNHCNAKARNPIKWAFLTKMQ